MKTLITAFVFIIATTFLPAAETKTEVVKPTTAADDAKANDAAVPDVYAIEGKFDRVVVLRFKHETDLLAGLERMVKERKIKNAVILAAIGSVRGYHYHTVSNRTFPSKNLYVQDPDTPADISSMNGYVIDGRLHPHITFATDKHAFGGHLEPGTTVFTFAVVTIGVLADGADLSRIDDKTYR
jgi:predicted DNA-binding protein with PD1-like motif